MSLAIPHQFRKHESPVSSTKVNENNSVIVSYINDLETSLLAGIYDLIPVGTKMVFYQAVAPAGWTLVTGINDKFLRIVSGGGGAHGGSGLAPSGTITLAHNHTVNSHTHTNSSHTHNLDYTTASTQFRGAPGSETAYIVSGDSDNQTLYSPSDAGSPATIRRFKSGTNSGGNTNTGASAPSTDSNLANIGFYYADVIVCQKD